MCEQTRKHSESQTWSVADLVAEAGKGDPSRVLGSMWGRLVRCEGRGAQNKTGFLPLSLPLPLQTPRATMPPSPASPRGLAPGAGRGVGAWAGASSLLPRESS